MHIVKFSVFTTFSIVLHCFRPTVSRVQVLNFEFIRLSCGKTSDKFAIDWQDFAVLNSSLSLLSKCDHNILTAISCP